MVYTLLKKGCKLELESWRAEEWSGSHSGLTEPACHQGLLSRIVVHSTNAIMPEQARKDVIRHALGRVVGTLGTKSPPAQLDGNKGNWEEC